MMLDDLDQELGWRAHRFVWGVSMERRIRQLNRFTVGWTNYFVLAETPSVSEELDQWHRRRLRQVRWKEWKRPQASISRYLIAALARELAVDQLRHPRVYRIDLGQQRQPPPGR